MRHLAQFSCLSPNFLQPFTHVQVAHRLDTILPFAFTNGNIPFDVFHLCYASISLDASDYGCWLVKKLNIKLKVRELLNGCQEVFVTLNCIETLGYQSLIEFASLQGLCLHSSPDQNDARDVAVDHFLSGKCVKMNGIF